MEKKLYSWFTKLIKEGYSVSPRMIKAKALKLTNNKDFNASKGWLAKFQNKYKLDLYCNKKKRLGSNYTADKKKNSNSIKLNNSKSHNIGKVEIKNEKDEEFIKEEDKPDINSKLDNNNDINQQELIINKPNISDNLDNFHIDYFDNFNHKCIKNEFLEQELYDINNESSINNSNNINFTNNTNLLDYLSKYNN